MNFKNLPAYELIQSEQIEDIQSNGYLLRHKKSGARVMLIENEDDNKVFHIAFRTTPKDSTGVAHIMEHTVLCGSREFPSKDPFVELVKGSMNTFLNAMTYPDKTMFPVASCNAVDFANLMHVYLDAVFYPNIYKKEEIFRQEGWNYQLEKPEDAIEYNGVVYNEMKGAYSSAEDVLERQIMNSLFPDNTYAYESGGDPECIPDLTYEDYLDFHRTYYHPSNSYIYLYGDVDFEERLNWLDEHYLSSFEQKKVDSAIPLQTPFAKLQTIRTQHPIAAGEDEQDNTFLAYNVAVGTSLDTRLAAACAVLEYVLLEAPGAVLKEALLKAGIGQDIMSSYDSGIRQPVFSIIAKEANAQDADRFMEIIRKTLEQVCAEKIDENAIRAAINMMDFRFREADYGSYPKGLIYGIDVMDSWLYDDAHPFDYLKQTADYDFLKAQIGTDYYEDLVRTYLLDNTHATLVISTPQKGLTAQADQKVREKLDAYKETLSEDEIAKLVEKTALLRTFQETPSTQEELEKIPMLTRADMTRDVRPVRNVRHSVAGVDLVHHDYQTNGIAYIQLIMDASSVKREDLPYLSMLKSVLGMVSTAHYSYSELFNQINIHTGGITPGISSYSDLQDTKKISVNLGMQVRTLYDQIPFSFSMIEEILLSSDLGEYERLQEIVQKLKSRTGVRLQESGSVTAAIRCESHFSGSGQVTDATTGVEFYRAVSEVADHFAEQKEELSARLRSILRQILADPNLMVSYTGSEDGLEKVKEGIAHLAKQLGIKAQDKKMLPKAYPHLVFARKNEGFKTSAKVQYVARCGNFRDAGHAYHGALRVLRTLMSYDYLWNQVRVVGGAYGCSASFGRNGDTIFTSYRDPHLRRTNEVYEGVPAYLESFDASERDMTKYVIGTISGMDTPMNPSALGARSFSIYVSGQSLESLREEREQVLQVTKEDIRALAPLIREALAQDYLCVLGNEDKLEQEKEMFDELTMLS